MKKNNKGYVLVELLAASIVILSLFTFVFTSLSPSRENIRNKIKYTDTDSTYTLFYFRKLFLKSFYDFKDKNYITLYDGNTCTDILDEETKKTCNDIASEIKKDKHDIKEIILTKNISKLKESYPESGKMYDYIKYIKNNTEDNEFLYILIKTSTGYSISNLYTDTIPCEFLKEDNTTEINIKANETTSLFMICTSKDELVEYNIPKENIIIKDKNGKDLSTIVESITYTNPKATEHQFMITLKTPQDIDDIEQPLTLTVKAFSIKNKKGTQNNDVLLNNINISKGDDTNA